MTSNKFSTEDLTQVKKMIGEMENSTGDFYSIDDIVAEVKGEGGLSSPDKTAQPFSSDAKMRKEQILNINQRDEKEKDIAVQSENIKEYPVKIEAKEHVEIPKIQGDFPKERVIRFTEEEDGLFEDEEEQPKKKRFFGRRTRDAQESVLEEEEYDEEPLSQKPPKIKKPLLYDFDKKDYRDAEEASKNCGKQASGYLSRTFIMLPFLLCAIYLSIAPMFSLPIPFSLTYVNAPYLYLLVLIVLEIVCMILSLDILAAGLYRLLHLRPTMDSLVFFTALTSLVHAISILLFPEWGGYLPYTSVSCLILWMAVLCRYQKKLGQKRVYKALSLSKTPVGVNVYEIGTKEQRAFRHLTDEEVDKLMDKMNGPDRLERFSEIYAPLALISTIVFAVRASIGQGQAQLFLWALSAISMLCAPFGLLMSFSWPFRVVSRRLFNAGAALIGFQGTKKLSKSTRAVLFDADIFPPGTVAINGLKILGNHSFERILGYTASAIEASGSGLTKLFLDLAQKQFVKPLGVSKLTHYDSGGIEAVVNGDTLLVGTSGFLLRMGVRVTEGLNLKSGVFVALNGEHVGIFALKYQPTPQVHMAFQMLKRHKITPVLASKDFNIAPGMVENKFKLKSETIDFPDIEERLALADEFEKLEGFDCDDVAVLTRDGMLPLAECMIGAKKLIKASKKGIILGTLSAVIGILLMYFLTFEFAFAAASPYNVLVYLVLWSLPSYLISYSAGRY